MSDKIDYTIRKMFLIEKKKPEDISNELNIGIEYVLKITNKFKPKHRSKGEADLLKILKTIYPMHDINEQHGIGGMRFDFYIPKLRLAIEYDGLPHFEKVDHFFGKGNAGQANFENYINNDRRKEKAAAKSNIYLIRIPYSLKLGVENVRELLNEHNSKIISNLSNYSATHRYNI